MPDKSPLLAWYDADPAGWKPLFYPVFIDLGIAAGARATSVINTIFAPYMWTEVTHGIVGNIDDPETSGLYNDGQYLVSFSDERHNYTNAPTPANLLFGPHKEGSFKELPIPIFFPANHSVNISIENIYARILTPESPTFRVYFLLKGMSYWGDLAPPKEILNMSMGRPR